MQNMQALRARIEKETSDCDHIARPHAVEIFNRLATLPVPETLGIT